jgi:hypothetical protein
MDPNLLPIFSGWLRTLSEDVLSLANRLEASDTPTPLRTASAEALQYLLRSADLVPDGLEDLGYLETAFAFRLIARRALAGEAGVGEASSDAVARFRRLSDEAERIAELLGGELAAFSEFCLTPAASTFRGTPAQALLEDAERRSAVLGEARAWAESYRAPELADGAEELVKIRSFLATRARARA